MRCTGPEFDDTELIHEALVCVYKDLLLFYYAVVHVLTKESVARAWISEQFNERIPPVVQDFLKHANLLHQHINNATIKVIQCIESLLLDAKIQKALGSDHLDELEKIHLGLRTKMATDACKWIKDHQNFEAWHQATTANPLVLYGEMGSGKTVTMAFMIDPVIQLNQTTIPSAFICYHYCREGDAGTSLHVYSSFIQQLMREKPQIKVHFNSWLEKHKSESNFSPTHDSKLLGDFFFDSIKSLERPVFIFLDGLDECNEQSCKELVTRLKHQSLQIRGLRCCLSVRYHEQIQTLLQGLSEIPIKKDAKRDAVLVSHLVKTELETLLDRQGQNLVIHRLSTLAEGSAIWVRMAVDLVKARKSSAIRPLDRFIEDDLPRLKLPDLYAQLFSQVTVEDDDNAKLLSDALEILAITERPLSIVELGWAVALRDSGAGIETVQQLEDYVDAKRVLRFLSPFISSHRAKAENERQVCLAHQSVRELVFQSPPRHWAHLQQSDAAIHKRRSVAALDKRQYDAAIHKRRSELHGKLARDCVRYLLLAEIGDRKLFSDEQEWVHSFDRLPGPDVFNDDANVTNIAASGEMAAVPPPDFDPTERGFGGIFTYASTYWLHHLQKAECGNGPVLSDVITLSMPGTTRSENWWEQFCRPDCTRQRDESKARPETFDPLTIVSLYGPKYLFDELMKELSIPAEGGLSITTEWRENAVKTILQQGDMSRLPQLIRFDADAKIDEAIFLSVKVMLHWSEKDGSLTENEKKNFDPIFDRIKSGFDKMVEQKRGNEMLCLAASYGCLPILERLFEAAASYPDLKQEILRTPHRDNGKSLDAVRHQSIGDAAWNGKAAAVAFLLKQQGIEAHLRYRDLKGSNVLHKAVRGSDVETLKLLLSRYPEGMSELDCWGNTPLRQLVFKRRQHGADLVRVFLEAGADVRCGLEELPSDWREPIRMASRYGDLDVIKTLVRVGGADPMSVFKQGQDGELDFIDPYDHEFMKDVKETLLSLRGEGKEGSSTG